MANTTNHAYLPDQKILALIIGLCEEIKTAGSTTDAADLLANLLTPQEIRMIAIRLRIKEMLDGGMGYIAIREELGVSLGTISRVRLGQEHLDKRPRSTGSPRKKTPDHPLATRSQANTSLSGPMGKYSSLGWPIHFLAAAIKEITEKNRSP
jgi:uncharacterized protein YerC